VVADVVRQHCVGQGAAGDVVRAHDYVRLETVATDGRLTLIRTHDELDDVVARLVTIRKASSANEAERQLGLSRGAPSKWASKYGFALAPPRRPRRH